jgi:vacuolar-type H+-ATPase subunit H
MAKNKCEDSSQPSIPYLPNFSSTLESIESILNKEDAIKDRIERAEKEAGRLIDDAKMDAAVIKRKAMAKEVGMDVREQELARASEEAEEAASVILAQADKIKSDAMGHIEKAVDIIVSKVLPPETT